jgi:hypothetical protein
MILQDLKRTYYGALLDGATDDSAAFQSACNAAAAVGGGVVEIESCSAVIANVVAPANVSVRGAGRFATVLKVKNIVGAVGLTLGDQGHARDLTVQLPSTAQTTTASVGTGNGSTTTFTGTAASLPLSPFFFGITKNGSFVAQDDGSGNITGTGVTGTVNYVTGAFSVTFTTAPTSGQAIAVSYWYQVVGVQMGGAFGGTESAIELERVNVTGTYGAGVGVLSRSCEKGVLRHCEIRNQRVGLKLEQNPANGSQLATGFVVHACAIHLNTTGIMSAGEINLTGGTVVQGNCFGYEDDLGAAGSIYTQLVSHGTHWENGVDGGTIIGGLTNVRVHTHQASTAKFYGDTFQGAASGKDLVTSAPAVYAYGCKFQSGAGTSSTGTIYIFWPSFASPSTPTWTASGGAIRRRNGDGTENVYVGGTDVAGGYQGPMRLGSSYLWIDSSARLRTKATAPTSDTDGTVVGTQT